MSPKLRLVLASQKPGTKEGSEPAQPCLSLSCSGVYQVEGEPPPPAPGTFPCRAACLLHLKQQPIHLLLVCQAQTAGLFSGGNCHPLTIASSSLSSKSEVRISIWLVPGWPVIRQTFDQVSYPRPLSCVWEKPHGA